MVDLGPCKDLDAGERLQPGSRGVLLAVLDGMGGTQAGDRAAEIAAQVLKQQMEGAKAEDEARLADALVRGLFEANVAILDEGRRIPERRGMGTTLTAAVLLDRSLILAHVGDSRAYLFRKDTLQQLSVDQSLLPPETLDRDGRLVGGQRGHSNVILQALGIGEFLEPMVARAELSDGDVLLLCTDGLSAQVGDELIATLLHERQERLPEAATELIALANRFGGQDNATVVLARLGEPPTGEPEAASPSDPPGPMAQPKEAPPGIVLQPLLPPSLKEHLHRRAVRHTLTMTGIVVLLLVILVGLVLLIQGCTLSTSGPRLHATLDRSSSTEGTGPQPALPVRRTPCSRW